MKRLTLIGFLIFSSLIIANSEMSEFEKYKSNKNNMYKEYKSEIERRFENYKNNIKEEWVKIEVPDNYKWVEYSDDFKERTIVDYDNEEVVIQVTVSKDTSEKVAQDKILKNMQGIMKQYVSDASKKNPFIEDGKSLKSKETIVADIYKVSGKKPKEIEKETKKLLAKEKIKVSKGKKKDDKVVEVTVPFPKDGILNKAGKYQNHVTKRSKEYKVEDSLIYAIIHSESAFNPMARSHVPAYGLMQIVPVSAGKDISKRLYGEVKIFTPEYLYNGENNIEAGANYINLLYYSYLKGIKDPISRKYCTIAAYNTGTGNIAKAFTGTTNLNKALPIINSMSSKAVYNKLLKDLPYEETKGYLKKVVKRDTYYKEKIKELGKV